MGADSVRTVRFEVAGAREAAQRAAAVACGGVKGDGGLLLVTGGSRAYGAPPFIAGLAAKRVGVHGVWVTAPDVAAAGAAGLEVHVIESGGGELDDAAVRAMAAASSRLVGRAAADGAQGRVVWLVGPGLGGSPTAHQVLDALVEARRTDRSAALVVDGSLGGGQLARARIRALGTDLVLLNRHEAHALLSPDPRTAQGAGRAGRVETGRLAELAREIGAVTLAKGQNDVITDGESAWQVHGGHPGLARHATGDVLAGAVAALLGQQLPAHEAAALGCHLLGAAGTRLTRRYGTGWLTRELIDAVGLALRALTAGPSNPAPPAD